MTELEQKIITIIETTLPQKIEENPYFIRYTFYEVIVKHNLPQKAEIETPNNNKEVPKPKKELPELESINTSNKENLIIMVLNIGEKDVNKPFKFLFNIKEILKGCDMRKLNETNTELYINNKKVIYKSYFIPEKEGICNIQIKINIKLEGLSGLFYDLNNLVGLDLSSFDFQGVTHIDKIFYKCYNLLYIKLSSFNATKITNVKNLFDDCYNLKELDLSSFTATNVTDMNNMFNKCKQLEKINLSSFNAPNVTNMGYMFSDCKQLKDINLSSFSAPNVTNMCYMFYNCNKLKILDLSFFKTKYVEDIRWMFEGCNNLEKVILSIEGSKIKDKLSSDQIVFI